MTVDSKSGRPHVLVLSSVFPSRVDATVGPFVKERVAAVNRTGRWQMRVVSPTPYFPKVPCGPERWRTLASYPREEVIEGLSIQRPRYPLVPKVGGYFHDDLMYWSIRRLIQRLHREWGIALIDSHFVYPDGVVAVRLAKDLGVPVVLTSRGGDILQQGSEWRVSDRIRWAHRNGSQFVALSEELAAAMRNLDAPADRLTVISNGVDLEKFRPINRDQARRELGLDPALPLIVGVGALRELKGYHIAIQALPEVRRTLPQATLAIVGGVARHGDDYSRQIEDCIQQTGMRQAVLMAGRKNPEELFRWYSAADVFLLLSSREGSPNAAMEALACGTPMVATPVGSVPQIMTSPGLGLMLRDRSVPEVIRGLLEALGQTWDRQAIRHGAEQNSWEGVATRVNEVFDKALAQ
ncbi:MAG: glycosyltransferase, partial [Planctomycetaceae bacterium]